MSTPPQRTFTPAEYLELESRAGYKSQYVDGEIFAMAGTQLAHNKIAGNIYVALQNQFRGRPCRSYFADVRLNVAEGGLYTYPDVMALCGEPRLDHASNPPSLTNPQVIFEVLSPATEVFDRGDKFRRYRKLESLIDYVLISVQRMRVEHHRRQPSGVWAFEEYEHLASRVRLDSVHCEVVLMDIYNGTKPGGAEGS